MLKTIPQSNISKRKFQVYKLWNVNQSDFPIVTSSLDDSFYRSIKSKYYSNDGNVITLFGNTQNISNINVERQIADTIYVAAIDRIKLGEGIKPNSVRLTDSDSNLEYIDNGYGKIIAPSPSYELVNIDVENSVLTIRQNSVEYAITITIIDLQTGYCVLTLNGDTDEYYLVSINLQTNVIVFELELTFEGTDLQSLSYGNIFYTDGVLVLTSLELENYQLEYRSTHTIYETEVLVTARAGEFNYSQNPSAVDVVLNNSYDFETTAIPNGSPAGVVKIKEVLDITQKNIFGGSVGSSVGTWSDYYNSSSIDPTGSYLSTYITTIGLYDSDGDMVAIAKLPNPIKNLPDYDINFLIRFDT
jgi:hypothetical protein